MQPNPRLKHVDEGAVSISLNGDEVAISLGRATPLDKTHQVSEPAGQPSNSLRAIDRLNMDHADVN